MLDETPRGCDHTLRVNGMGASLSWLSWLRHKLRMPSPQGGDPSTVRQEATTSGSYNTVVIASGTNIDISVAKQHVHLILQSYAERSKLAQQESSDVALLSPYRDDVLPLIGRDDVLADLWRWLDAGHSISVRTITGAGGRGKTRLARALATEAVARGWSAGFVTAEEIDRFRSQTNVANWLWAPKTLVIIDYAASRAGQIHDWLKELVNIAPREAAPLRILLLERQAQTDIGWYASVVGYGDNDTSRAIRRTCDPPAPVELAPLDTVAFRRRVFETMLRHKSPGAVVPDAAAFDRLLGEHKWAGDPLYLMMAGLAAGEVGVPSALSLGRTDLAFSVARNELDRIGRIAAERGIDPSAQPDQIGLSARHIAVVASLTQGISVTTLRRLIEAGHVRAPTNVDPTALIGACLDSLSTAADGREILPITPDIIGEAAIVHWLGDDHQVAGGRTGVLGRLGLDATSTIRGVAREALDRVSQTLIRVAQDFAITGHVETVRWIQDLAVDAGSDIGALMTIASELPEDTVELREAAEGITASIVTKLRSLLDTAIDTARRESVSATLAQWTNNLGNRLGALGRREEALDAAREAVDLHRALAAARPDAFHPNLAMSLNNYAGTLRGLGRREDALDAAREAVDLHRTLAAELPGTFRPDLATSLNSYAVALSDLGRREEALDAAREAVDLYRALDIARPDALRPDLAMSLSNYANKLSDLGRREEALDAAREAVDLYRALDAARPDAFRPGLATSLNNYAVTLGDLGRREEALDAASQAIGLYRTLDAARPDAFRSDLAALLNNYATTLSGLGRHEEALDSAREAVDLYRTLEVARPGAFRPNLAMSLNNCAAMLSALGRREEALDAAREAVDIRRTLDATWPDAFRANLATSLNNYANMLSDQGRHEEALNAAREAVDIRRALAAMRPDAFRPDLAGSLSNYAVRLSDLGRREEALNAAREAVGTLRPHFIRRPPAHVDHMRVICRVYIRACEALKHEPDGDLLAPIVEQLRTMTGETS